MATPSLQVFAGVKSYSIKGKLMTKKDLQTLSESRDLDELVTRIKNTTYNDAISKIQKPYTTQKIEIALRDRQADLHHTMMQASGGSNVMFAYYLKFILKNLKIILKGKILGRPQSEIESMISLHPEELIKERDIVLKALVAKDFEEAASVLKGIGIGEEIEQMYSLYNERKQIQVLDMYFDKFFYENLGRAMKSSGDFSLHSVCGIEIDYYNIMSILRGKFWNLDENQLQHLIVSNASSESREMFTKMISADSLKSALNELLNTHYKGMVPQDENGAISKFESSFERKIYNTMNSQFVRIFGFSTIVAIVRLLDFEVRNLSAITYAVEQKIPSDTVMSKIIIKD
ncbi:V0D/AC39 family V-type ATPase subunit [Candidatus Nitrosotenuis cloacae]|uniref:ATPase n=1 Tax=Candidatus Nitrosotenuis cloacae TaxID=1603555 RepID=A0A3G1B6G7_9ARCH|nr:V-type ATPase subunit [Candidatus Nitrosotenuis cloacae]AJZ76510.1 ATPase [Candidatus Nitrosotenuis cloacae]